jgi:shikimate kinase
MRDENAEATAASSRALNEPTADSDPTNTDPKNIVLTGFMGTGKSTVGKVLADRLGLKHLDTDQLIERRHGPIPRIFEQLGETGFREIERSVAEELARDEGYVISTGGHVMIDPGNADLLSEGNRVFCLVANVDTIFARVMRRRSSRPVLNVADPRARIEELLAERAAGYARFEAVPTDENPVSRVVDDIIRRLGQ